MALSKLSPIFGNSSIPCMMTMQGHCLPIIFFLPPKKTKTFYHQLLRVLQKCVPTVPQQTWMFDVEATMVNAHKESTPETTSGGCLFHLSKTMHKKMESLGFRKCYVECSEFRRRVVALNEKRSVGLFPPSFWKTSLGYPHKRCGTILSFATAIDAQHFAPIDSNVERQFASSNCVG